jgi:hypothetical protein
MFSGDEYSTMLVLPIKNQIVHFSLGKLFCLLQFGSWFFLIPFSIVLMVEGYDVLSVVLWYSAIFSLLYINNFINIILSNKDNLFTIFLIVAAVLEDYNTMDCSNHGLYGAIIHTMFDSYWALQFQYCL